MRLRTDADRATAARRSKMQHDLRECRVNVVHFDRGSIDRQRARHHNRPRHTARQLMGLVGRIQQRDIVGPSRVQRVWTGDENCCHPRPLARRQCEPALPDEWA